MVTRHIPARYFQLLRDVVQENGVSADLWLRQAGVSEQALTARDSLLTASQADALADAALALCERSDIAFEMGRRIKTNSHSLLGYGLISCNTFDEYMRMAQRHYHLMIETWTLRYRLVPGGAEATYTPTVAMSSELLAFYLEVLALAHHNQMVLMLGERLPPYDIYLSMKAPPHIQRYYQLGRARFHFDEGELAAVRVVMDSDMLRLPLAMGNPDVARDIDERCSKLAQRPARGVDNWIDYVTMVLQESQGGLVTLDDIARRANVSARTIDRHLKQEGQRFRELAEKIRFEKACAMLAAPGTRITDVAELLGFSDTANFSRAFQRVMGVSPSQYRSQLTG